MKIFMSKYVQEKFFANISKTKIERKLYIQRKIIQNDNIDNIFQGH